MSESARNAIYTHTKEQMEKLVGIVGSDANGPIDFNNIVPVPEAINLDEDYEIGANERAMVLAITNGEFREISEDDFWGYLKKFNISSDYSLDELCRKLCGWHPVERDDSQSMQSTISKGLRLLHTYARYGACDWYHWCRNEWGTKWNAFYAETKENMLTFWTAWNGVPELMRKMSALDGIDFPIYYQFGLEIFGKDTGELILQNGKPIEYWFEYWFDNDGEHRQNDVKRQFCISSNLLDTEHGSDQEEYRYDPKNDEIVSKYSFDNGPYNGYAKFEDIPRLESTETEMFTRFMEGAF